MRLTRLKQKRIIVPPPPEEPPEGDYPDVVVARSLQSTWDRAGDCGPRSGHTLTQLTTGNATSLLGGSGYTVVSGSPNRIAFSATKTINDVDFSGWNVMVNGATGVVFNDCKFQLTGHILLIVGATSGFSATTGASATFNYCEIDGTGQTDLFASTVLINGSNDATFFRCHHHSSPRTHIMSLANTHVFVTDCYWQTFGKRSENPESVHVNAFHQGGGELTIDGLFSDLRDAEGTTMPLTFTSHIFHEGFAGAVTKGIVTNSIFIGTELYADGDSNYTLRNQDYTYGSTGIQWVNNIIAAGGNGFWMLDNAGPMNSATGDLRYDNFDYATGNRITTPAEITP